MKMVMAIVKPFKREEVREALTAVGVQGLTVSDVKGSADKSADGDLSGRRYR
jgi:nitrogen regulatory protein PII